MLIVSMYYINVTVLNAEFAVQKTDSQYPHLAQEVAIKPVLLNRACAAL